MNTPNQHTPGKWRVKQWGTDHDEWPDRRLSVGTDAGSVAISPRYPSEHTEADFALMAAAPELLEACRAARMVMNTSMLDYASLNDGQAAESHVHALKLLDSAIHKAAEGEQS